MRRATELVTSSYILYVAMGYVAIKNYSRYIYIYIYIYVVIYEPYMHIMSRVYSTKV